ncbi:MAG: MotA/TolQ/ExbB proton channel family protein [Planctomycetia bacterium]|nr:MotA/TolQ/ExbB proton channel family protein [Planctomycetia bacterium]
MWDHTLPELFFKGGVVMWPLLACSILGLALMLERAAVLLWKSIPFAPLREALRQRVRAGKLDAAQAEAAASRSPVARVAAAYLRHRDSPDKLREEATGTEASRQLAGLERRMAVLAMVVQVAPLLGLLGTVTGLVDAFHQIEVKAGQVQPGDLAAGIWEALLTTVFGLVIAVPCQMAHTLLDQRIHTLALQMEWITNDLDEWLNLTTGEAAEPAGAGAAPLRR